MPLPYRRPDGSYVIQGRRGPYHVTQADPRFAMVAAALDGKALDEEPPPPPLPDLSRTLPVVEFLERFSEAERIAIRVAARGASQAARRLDDALDLIRAARAVPLDSQRVQGFVAALVAAGLLTEDRAAAILA